MKQQRKKEAPRQPNNAASVLLGFTALLNVRRQAERNVHNRFQLHGGALLRGRPEFPLTKRAHSVGVQSLANPPHPLAPSHSAFPPNHASEHSSPRPPPPT